MSEKKLNKSEDFHYYYTPKEEETCDEGCTTRNYKIYYFEIF